MLLCDETPISTVFMECVFYILLRFFINTCKKRFSKNISLKVLWYSWRMTYLHTFPGSEPFLQVLESDRVTHVLGNYRPLEKIKEEKKTS